MKTIIKSVNLISAKWRKSKNEVSQESSLKFSNLLKAYITCISWHIVPIFWEVKCSWSLIILMYFIFISQTLNEHNMRFVLFATLPKLGICNCVQIKVWQSGERAKMKFGKRANKTNPILCSFRIIEIKRKLHHDNYWPGAFHFPKMGTIC